jgi:hypothetical protein
MSEFSESYDQAFAIHRAISRVMGETRHGDPITLADVVRQLAPNLSAFDKATLVASIVSAARDAGVEVVSDEAQADDSQGRDSNATMDC